MPRRHGQKDEAEINLTPMLDVTFIMLIFFIVTTSFVKEAGREVTRPVAETALEQRKASIMIAVADDGQIWMQNRPVELRDVRLNVERLHAESPEGGVVIIADKNSDTAVVVDLLDQIKLAGVEMIAIATERPGG